MSLNVVCRPSTKVARGPLHIPKQNQDSHGMYENEDVFENEMRIRTQEHAQETLWWSGFIERQFSTLSAADAIHASTRKLGRTHAIDHNSLCVVRFVERPLQVQPVAGGNSQVHLYGEKGLDEVLLAGLPSDAVHRRGHLIQMYRLQQETSTVDGRLYKKAVFRGVVWETSLSGLLRRQCIKSEVHNDQRYRVPVRVHFEYPQEAFVPANVRYPL